MAETMSTQNRERNPNWRGGRTRASNGYILVRVGVDHHLADIRGYAYEHRIVAEAKIGRRLEPGEEIHHINGKKEDNRPENIEVVTRQIHSVEHRTEKNRNRLRMPGETNPVVACACGCGEHFNKFDADGRPRMFISGHNVTRNGKGQFSVRDHG